MAVNLIEHFGGWRPQLPDVRDFKLVRAYEESALPASVDLRPMCCKIWNQLALGSCTSHALAFIFEFAQRKEHPQWDYMPSRLFLYYSEREIEGTIDQDAGAMLRDGAKALKAKGLPREDLWPYDIGSFAQRPPEKAYLNALQHQSLNYHAVPQTQGDLESALASGFPIAFGFTVYSSFEDDSVAKTGIVPMPYPADSVLGGHAVALCGFNRQARTFLCRNSWGELWGQQGYFTMPYDYVLNSDLASDFWVVTTVS